MFSCFSCLCSILVNTRLGIYSHRQLKATEIMWTDRNHGFTEYKQFEYAKCLL